MGSDELVERLAAVKDKFPAGSPERATVWEAITRLRAQVPEGWVVVRKAEFQRALEGIKVPKMSPVKQECFKAGTHAVIRAFNEVFDAAPTPQQGVDGG